ncbi:MAG: HD domain-containing protein [Thermoguttaceae bacterium]
MIPYFDGENLSQDPIHGYVPFSAHRESQDEVTERDIIDSPWMQRLRQIHQLQTAWLVFPTGEHTRFQHSIGAMHLASRFLNQFYQSLLDVCSSTRENANKKDDESAAQIADEKLPSRGYMESLVRMAALLHDVGHGPFGHFFDAKYLSQFGLNHEKLGAEIIQQQLGPMLKRVRRNPTSALEVNETLDPSEIAFLIVRPGTSVQNKNGEQKGKINPPLWLKLLRSLFCGLYTVDNTDFVLRDAFMTGFSSRAFDLDRLLHYSFFTEKGLTVHQKGFSALTRFLAARADLFRSVYFHRTVRAIDLTLSELFAESQNILFPGENRIKKWTSDVHDSSANSPFSPEKSELDSRNPLKNLDDYLHFTDWSLLIDVSNWERSSDSRRRKLAPAWNDFVQRKIPIFMAAETTTLFLSSQRERTSIFSDSATFEKAIREELPPEDRQIPFIIDIARHLHRPDTKGASMAQNFLFEPGTDTIRCLEDEELFRHIPQSFRICRIYTKNIESIPKLAKALDSLVRGATSDDETNM